MTRNAAFEAADGNAADGGKKLTLIKNEYFEAMIEQLDEVADQIEYVAKGNEKLALDAGFELVAEVKSINYGIEYQKEGETTWENGTFSTSSSAILSGLEAGFYYNIRIYANGRKQLKSDSTDYVTVLVS